jgi:hypothetical protein
MAPGVRAISNECNAAFDILHRHSLKVHYSRLFRPKTSKIGISLTRESTTKYLTNGNNSIVMRESVEGGNQSTGGGTDRQIRKANASTDTGRANCDRVVTLVTIWEKPRFS